MDGVRRELGAYVGSDPQDVVFVDNASHGINAVLRSIMAATCRARSGTRSKVLYLDTAYRMVQNTLLWTTGIDHDQRIVLNVTYPTSKQALVALVQNAVASFGDELALAVFSHITSVPAMVLPIEEFIKVCHEAGVPVLIDGAHAMGQIPINLTALGADYYVSNCHKWGFCAQGAAWLFVQRERQGGIMPTVISLEGQGASPFQLAFSYQGTADYSAKVAMSAAFAFRQQYGDHAIMDYMHGLAIQAGKTLTARWNSSLLVGEDDDSLYAAMVNVGLPACVPPTEWPGLGLTLLSQKGTYVPAFGINGRGYVRVSLSIYNDLTDVAFLADAVLDVYCGGA